MARILSLFVLIGVIISFTVHAATLAVVQETAGRLDFYTTEGDWHWLGGLKLQDLPHEVAISKNGKTAYVANFGIRDYDSGAGTPGNTISVVDIASKKEKYQLTTDAASANIKAPHGIKFRPHHDNLLYVNAEIGNTMLVYDVNHRKIIQSFKISSNTHNFVFTPDGKYIWLMAGPDGVERIDADSGKIEAQIKLTTPVRGIKYLPKQHQLMLAAGNEIVFVDALTNKIVKRFQNLPSKQILYADITHDHKLIVAPDVWNNRVLIIDAISGKVLKKIATGSNPVTVMISTDDQYAYVANASDKFISKINLKNFNQQKIYTFSGPNGMALLS